MFLQKIESRNTDRRPVTFVRSALCMLTAVASLVGTSAAVAESWPSKPIQLVVPYPAGGAADIHARLLAAPLSEALGQAVVVENRTGAGGNIAFNYVAKAKPDGYTILFGAGAITVTPSIYKKPLFDVINDFAPISTLVLLQNVLTVPDDSPFKNVKDLIAAAKAAPGKLTYASSGIGATPQLTMELFKQMAGMNILGIPYRGDTPGYLALMGHQTDMFFSTLGGGIPHIRGGKVRALAVSSQKSSPVLPDIPPLSDVVPGFEIVSWFGLLAPKGTSNDIVERLNAEVRRLVAQPALQKAYLDMGSEPATSTPEEFAALIRSNVELFAKIAKTANIEPQ